MAGRGRARHGGAWRGLVGVVDFDAKRAKYGKAGRGLAGLGTAGQGLAGRGKAGRGGARQGRAWNIIEKGERNGNDNKNESGRATS